MNLVDLKYNFRKGIKQAVALVTRVKWHWTKKGKKMAFIELEDETGYLSCIMWPEGVLKFSKYFQVGSILKLYIKKEDNDNFFVDDKRKIELVKRSWELVGHIEGETSNKDIEKKN